MAEWKEVIHNVKRICELREGKCGTCRLGAFGCPNNSRFDMTDEKEFDRFAEEVMQWAKDNPEPVYPTWREYLESIGVIVPRKNYTVMDAYALIIGQINTTRISTDIAWKLGLQPRRQ